jgi:hypothetical protein
MSDQSPDNEKEFLAAIETQLASWQLWWKIYMWGHYSLGITGVICSTLAASSVFADNDQAKVASLVSAACFAIIGFVRPEAKYRNMVRAWGELKSGRDAYLFKTNEKRGELLDTLRKCQNLATEDDIQTSKTTSDEVFITRSGPEPG